MNHSRTSSAQSIPATPPPRYHWADGSPNIANSDAQSTLLWTSSTGHGHEKLSRHRHLSTEILDNWPRKSARATQSTCSSKLATTLDVASLAIPLLFTGTYLQDCSGRCTNVPSALSVTAYRLDQKPTLNNYMGEIAEQATKIVSIPRPEGLRETDCRARVLRCFPYCLQPLSAGRSRPLLGSRSRERRVRN